MARTLAAGLLLAIAALVALPQTALAQTTCTVNTSGRTEIWTRTLTVGERVVFGETYYGYAVSSHGTLPNPSFNVGPNGYTIGALNRLGNELQFSLNSDLEDADRTNLRLHVCGDTFNPDDARLSTGSIYIWSNAGQTWTTGDTLSVALSVASPPGAVDSSLGTVRGLRASAENGRVTLSWTPPTSGGTPTSYEYRYKTNGGYGGWTTVTGGGAARSVTVSGLTNGTRHVFEVRARNGSRVGPGYLVDATPNTRPHAVETLSASPGDRQVTLAWTPPTSGGTPTGYQYSYTTSRTEPFRNWTTVSGGGAARGVTVSGLTNGLRHAFKVRAGNGSGVGPAYLVAATPGVVGAVGNLSASPGDRQVKLTWTPPQYGAERYEYRYKTTGGYGGWATAPSGSGARSVTVYGLINGTRYTFQVQARNGASSVGTASEVTATPPGAETPPGSVGNLGASAGNRQVTLAWTPPTSGEPPTGYEYRYTRDGTWTDVGGWQRGIVTVSGLSNGRSYRFELRARNGAGAGPESEVTARPTASPTSTAPDAVGNLSASAGYRQVTLTWSQPTSGGTPTNYEYTYSTSRTEPFRDWTTVTGGGRGPQCDCHRPDQRRAPRVQGAGVERLRRWHGVRGDRHAARRRRGNRSDAADRGVRGRAVEPRRRDGLHRAPGAERSGEQHRGRHPRQHLHGERRDAQRGTCGRRAKRSLGTDHRALGRRQRGPHPESGRDVRHTGDALHRRRTHALGRARAVHRGAAGHEQPRDPEGARGKRRQGPGHAPGGPGPGAPQFPGAAGRIGGGDGVAAADGGLCGAGRILHRRGRTAGDGHRDPDRRTAGLALGGRCHGGGGRGGGARVRGDAQPPVDTGGDGRLRHLGRHDDGGGGLCPHRGHAPLRHGGNVEDGARRGD